MSCGCGKSYGVSVTNNTSFINTNPVQNISEYSIETIINWKEVLECIEEKGKLKNYNIQKALYNSFLGVLISVVNNPSNLYYFSERLSVIEPYIIQIINNQEC